MWLVTDNDGEWVADLGDNFTDLLKFWTDMNNEYGVVPTGITEADYATAQLTTSQWDT